MDKLPGDLIVMFPEPPGFLETSTFTEVSTSADRSLFVEVSALTEIATFMAPSMFAEKIGVPRFLEPPTFLDLSGFLDEALTSPGGDTLGSYCLVGTVLPVSRLLLL